MDHRQDAVSDETVRRVSPTAPEFVSPSYKAWTTALRSQDFRADVEAGLEDLREGRTKPWSEIRSAIQ